MNVLLYIILTSLLGGGLHGQMERGIRGRLQDSMGPIEKVRVEVRRGHRLPISRTIEEINVELEGFRLKGGPPTEGLLFAKGKDVPAGKVNRIQVVARRFQVEGLLVKELRFTIERLRYNLRKALLRKRLEILDVGKCRGEILLEESALNHYISPKVKEIEGFRLRLERNRVEVSGRYKTRLGISVPIVFVTRLQPQIGKIYLIDPQLKVSVIPVPSFVTERVIGQINPIVDLNSDPALPCILRISRLQVEGARLRAETQIFLKLAVPVRSAGGEYKLASARAAAGRAQE